MFLSIINQQLLRKEYRSSTFPPAGPNRDPHRIIQLVTCNHPLGCGKKQKTKKPLPKFQTPHPCRQIRCTGARTPTSRLSKPGCDWWPASSLIVAAYRARRGAAGVVHGGRQPRDNSCTGGRKSQQSEQEKLTQSQAR